MDSILTTQNELMATIQEAAVTVGSTPQEEWTDGVLLSQLEQLQRYWESFENNHVALLQSDLAREHPYFREKTYTRIERLYITARGRIYDARVSPHADPRATSTPILEQPRGVTRLPRIVIPTFSGRREDWEPFRDLFRSLVHDDANLSDVDKLYYLKTSVQGDAKTALDSLTVTGPNYAIAWRNLETRYDHRRLLVQDHLKALKNLRPLRNESAASVQHLLDELTRHREQLRILGRPVDSWDDWLVLSATEAMDEVTRRDWEEELETFDALSTESRLPFSPTFTQCSDFLQRRCRTLQSLEATCPSRSSSGPTRSKLPGASRLRGLNAFVTTNSQCPSCKDSHYLGHCPQFRKRSAQERRELTIRERLCYNCLKRDHAAIACPSPSTCLVCGERHHTLLHGTSRKRSGSSAEFERPSKRVRGAVIGVLPTALVAVGDEFRPRRWIRALVDSCSESTFISVRLASKLGRRTQKDIVGVTAVTGGLMGSTLTRTQLHLHPPKSQRTVRIEAYGMRNLEIWTPSYHVGEHVKHLFRDLELADPGFTTPQGVDIVLGADAYHRIILPGLVRRDDFIAQRTSFGWMITGRRSGCRPALSISSHSISTCSPMIPWHEVLTAALQRFWAVEDVPRAKRQSPADVACETLYATRCRRDSTGRYIVPLPFIKDSLSSLGGSLACARSCLSSLHERMRRDPSLKREYNQFMDEYSELGHMRLLTPEEMSDQSVFSNYLPHHGIWQRKDGGKRLRVVFNASYPTTSGRSLNDVLYSGPKLQNDLLSVMTRWRRWAIAFCADIRMMFRQILVHRDDTNLQRIIWSPSPHEPERHYALNTVTYGETCAPYLALRTLRQLSIDEGAKFPEAVRAINYELYVDDFLCGADSEGDALRRRDQLIQLLQAGGFKLKKWVCNTQRFLNDIPPEDRLRPSWLQFASDGPVNELGILWDPVSDCIKFAPPQLDLDARITKRQVLAEIARLFDPAGWLSPIVLLAKMFMQDLWREQLDWDTNLPADKAREWRGFRSSLVDVTAIQLPRWLHWKPSSTVQLHAFADASRRAIAAVIYLRAVTGGDIVHVSLVTAKTKLSPAKSLPRADRASCRMTIPRLELRAALLAARLLHLVSNTLDISVENCQAWSDSNIVLHWLRSEQSLNNDFADNYVSHIHEVMPCVKWRYVCSADNPADVATRGLSPAHLNSKKSWWSGPAWLAEPITDWPHSADLTRLPPSSAPSLACAVSQLPSADIVDRFSNLDRLLRILVRCRRLFRRRLDPHCPAACDPTTPEELNHEYLLIVRRRQRQRYAEDIEALERGRPTPLRSPLRSLLPFLDGLKVLRVGGRLEHSNLTFSERHPVILDRQCHLSDLIVDWAHTRALHGGFRVTYAYTMRRAWIVGGRSAVKAHIHRCVICARSKRRTTNQVMAHLPEARVTPSRPFSRTGVDYAGPFSVLRSKGRGARSSKGYVAVFVCLSAKAVHLELAGDLSTASFLAALSRFSGRRGRPGELWSDNATNFRGADAELRRMLRRAEFHWGRIADSLSAEGIEWHFIPPSAPHFGGLWEAGVKSLKTHLRRTVGPRHLTYEEFNTLLVEVEMVLNSRPLGPVSGNPDDLDVLTPAHFLVGGPLSAHPHPGVEQIDVDNATHWRLVQGLRDRFWMRWSREYLNTLQQRWKWSSPREDIKIGDVVTIIDPSLLKSHGRWPLARVLSVYPGADQHVRVVRVKTEDGIYTRPITKLVRMPLSAPESSDPRN